MSHGTAFPAWYIAFQAAVLQQLPRPGVIDQDTALGWADNQKSLQKALAKTLLAPTVFSQSLTVLPDLDFAERIKRGNYGWTTSDVTEKKFPVTANQTGEWEWKLFHFDRNISSEEVIRLMQADGFEAGQIGHILAFGEAFPEEQQEYPIIGLGSVAEVHLFRSVPVLWYDYDRRKLGLGWPDNSWDGRCRFLGVRRHSVA